MKKFLTFLTFISILILATSCKGKVECDFCSETKYCKEYTLFDDEDAKMNICEDCLNDLEDLIGD